jgi:putative membrane protein
MQVVCHCLNAANRRRVGVAARGSTGPAQKVAINVCNWRRLVVGKLFARASATSVDTATSPGLNPSQGPAILGSPHAEDEVELILSWAVLSVAVWLTAATLPGFHVKNFGSAVLVAAIFGVLNFLLGWLLFALFTVVTLGIAYLLAFITRWIINAVLLVLTDKLTDHLHIDSFGWALGGALMMSVLGTIGEWLVRALL